MRERRDDCADPRPTPPWIGDLVAILDCFIYDTTEPSMLYFVQYQRSTRYLSRAAELRYRRFCLCQNDNRKKHRLLQLYPPGRKHEKNPELPHISDCAIMQLFLQNEQPHPMPQDDHQEVVQQPCPPQYVFSIYVSWPVNLYSELRFPETRENRLSAFVTVRPRPPRRLQSERKATKQSST